MKNALDCVVEFKAESLRSYKERKGVSKVFRFEQKKKIYEMVCREPKEDCEDLECYIIKNSEDIKSLMLL